MDINFEEQIRERAYQIWLAGGMSDGMAQEHWVSAEQEVLVEITAEPATVAATAEEPKRGRKAVSTPKAPRAKATRAAAKPATKATKAKH